MEAPAASPLVRRLPMDIRSNGDLAIQQRM